MAMIHVSRSGTTLGVFPEEKVREGLSTGEFIETDLGWTEGMASWRPLSQLDEFRAPPPPPQIPPVIGTEQPQSAPLVGTIGATTGRTGLPWENRAGRGFFNPLLETLAMVFTRPQEAFNLMHREGGFFDPVLYALIFGLVGGLISFGFSLVMQSIGMIADRGNAIGALLGVGTSAVFLLLLPVILVCCLFIGAAITHLCLMIVGGANQSFETTVRVLCYATGSANALQLIPFCGGIIAGVAGLVFSCIGLARAHETETWRAVVAVLLPLFVCCAASAILFAVLIGSIANWQ